jgi:hypothetical protein
MTYLHSERTTLDVDYDQFYADLQQVWRFLRRSLVLPITAMRAVLNGFELRFAV